jgi:hypothetical protein
MAISTLTYPARGNKFSLPYFPHSWTQLSQQSPYRKVYLAAVLQNAMFFFFELQYPYYVVPPLPHCQTFSEEMFFLKWKVYTRASTIFFLTIKLQP